MLTYYMYYVLRWGKGAAGKPGQGHGWSPVDRFASAPNPCMIKLIVWGAKLSLFLPHDDRKSVKL